MHIDTPAGRLLDLFDSMRALESREPFRMLWSRVLEHQPGSHEEISNFAELGRLLQTIRSGALAVSAADRGYEEEALLSGLSEWSKAVFGWGLGLTEADRYLGRDVVSKPGRDSLAALHQSVRSIAREGTFSSDLRDSLLRDAAEDLDGLMDEIGNSVDMPEAVRVALVGRLQNVRDSVDFVRFRGDQALMREMEATREIFERSRIELEGSHVEQRFRSWADTVANVSQRMISVFSGPVGAAYFISSGDAVGTAVILGAGSPQMLGKLVQALVASPGREVPLLEQADETD